MTRLHPPAPPLSPSWLPRRLQALCQRWPPFLRRRLAGTLGLSGWMQGRTQRVASGFYTSQAFELARPMQ